VNGQRVASANANEHLLKNNSTGGWVVQKFGGTSVGKLPVNIAEDIVRWGLSFLWAKLFTDCQTVQVFRTIESLSYALHEVQERKLRGQQVGESEPYQNQGIVLTLYSLKITGTVQHSRDGRYSKGRGRCSL
jgi:hypothetical protein